MLETIWSPNKGLRLVTIWSPNGWCVAEFGFWQGHVGRINRLDHCAVFTVFHPFDTMSLSKFAKTEDVLDLSIPKTNIVYPSSKFEEKFYADRIALTEEEI